MNDQQSTAGSDTTGKAPSSPAEVARAVVASGDASGIARFAGSSVLRAMGSIARGYLDTAQEIVEQVNAGEPITEIVDERVEQARKAAVSALGIADAGNGRQPRRGRALREQGDALIDVSWDPSAQPTGDHPAYQRILTELTPDEARIVRFLAVAGPQAAIDLRTRTPFGIGSVRLAAGISLIAETAGCTYPGNDHQYLANLNRLGLVRFSEEAVEDFRRYSILSAVPRTNSAREKAKKTIEIYRSIYLSVFGMDFAAACFTLDGYDAGGWANYKPTDKFIGKGPRTYTPKTLH